MATSCNVSLQMEIYQKLGGLARTGHGMDSLRTLSIEGSCGSPIWNEIGNLVCFFRFLMTEGFRSGFGIGVSATELRKVGLDLCNGHVTA
jgi:hypothetical protein